MKPLPEVSWTPDALSELDDCLKFVGFYSWGRPAARERDIARAVRRVRLNPLSCPVQLRGPVSGLNYRRHNAAQFALIYVYVPPSNEFPVGMISIHALRHGSERNVLWGMRQRSVPYGGTFVRP